MAEIRRSGPRQGRPDTTTRSDPTYRRRVIAIGWHRRNCKAFDRWALDFYGEELCARYGIRADARRPAAYASGGMDLDWQSREYAA